LIGFNEYIRKIYNHLIRPHLPRKIGVFNGIPLRKPKLFDINDYFPDWEEGILRGIEEATSPGAKVIIIGGGWGGSTVKAAGLVGSKGSVIVYEGGMEQARLLKYNLIINEVVGNVEVINSVVGSPVNVYGEKTGDIISPNELPQCDLLVLDCEGSELEIVSNIRNKPNDMVIEVHPKNGVSLVDMEELLESIGYEIIWVWDSQENHPPVVLASLSS